MRQRLARCLLWMGRVCTRKDDRSAAARSLIVAPHPDDEVLGCGGTIAQKVLAGADVCVVIVTDGRTSHASLIDAAELVAIRKAEAKNAARELGLESCEFLDFPDGELRQHEAVASATIGRIIASFRPDEIYVPHRSDRQPDHEATYRIVCAALAGHTQPVTIFEYPVWLWHSWPWTRGAGRRVGTRYVRHIWNVLSGIWEVAFRCSGRTIVNEALDRKMKALAAYESQMRRRGNDPQWPIMDDVDGGEFIRHFTRPEERFRKSLHRQS